jgi:hypothetical protein
MNSPVSRKQNTIPNEWKNIYSMDKSMLI